MNFLDSIDTRTLLLIVSPLIFISLILVIVSVVSIARKQLPWSDKWIWLPLLIVNIVGPIIYLVIGSSILDEKAANLQDKEHDQ